MRLILLSGGSGKRLWPLSNDARSKQFLKVLPDDRGGLQSMVQRVWAQLAAAGLHESAYIAAGKAQADMLQNQLGSDVRLIIEPERRDTFPAIALACSYLHSACNADREEVVAVLPVDPYTDDMFFETVKRLEHALLCSGASLALIGAIPAYPSEKYGYMVPKEGRASQWIHVKHFREKPTADEARLLIGREALWNCGVFAFRLGFMLDRISELGLSCTYETLRKNYAALPKISFDYQITEKTRDVIALRYDGRWKDLGTWNTLTEEMQRQVVGNGVLSPDCQNTHLVNELDIPAAVLGISNAVVAVSPDGILVADKEAAPRVKELVNRLGGRPMFEERRWGWYRVLDHTRFPSGKEVLTKRIGIRAGRNLSYQMHFFRSEIWTVISGSGQFALDGVIYPVKAGDVLQIKIQAKHGIRAVTDMEIIEVQMGRELVEEDIVRLLLTWDEIESQCVSRLGLEVASVAGRV